MNLLLTKEIQFISICYQIDPLVRYPIKKESKNIKRNRNKTTDFSTCQRIKIHTYRSLIISHNNKIQIEASRNQNLK